MNGGLYGGQSLSVEMKCLDDLLLFRKDSRNEEGSFRVNTLCELR